MIKLNNKMAYQFKQGNSLKANGTSSSNLIGLNNTISSGHSAQLPAKLANSSAPAWNVPTITHNPSNYNIPISNPTQVPSIPLPSLSSPRVGPSFPPNDQRNLKRPLEDNEDSTAAKRR